VRVNASGQGGRSGSGGNSPGQKRKNINSRARAGTGKTPGIIPRRCPERGKEGNEGTQRSACEHSPALEKVERSRGGKHNHSERTLGEQERQNIYKKVPTLAVREKPCRKMGVRKVEAKPGMTTVKLASQQTSRKIEVSPT